MTKNQRHCCQTLVLSCIDFRFQEIVRRFLKNQGLGGNYDLVCLAGAGKQLLAEGRSVVLRQISLSSRLHQIKEVFLINHQNCGAYGEGLISGSKEEMERHRADLLKAKKVVKEEFPLLTVRVCFARLDGVVLEVI